MAVLDSEVLKHRVLRETFRHYLEFRDLFRDNGTHVIDHGYYVYDDDGERHKIEISLSLWDLQDALKELSPRKREAVFYNVILDKRQEDAARIMGITTVSVGQYVEQSMLQLAKDYFDEDELVKNNLLTRK